MKGRRSFALTLLALGIPGCSRDDGDGLRGGTAEPDDDADRSPGDCWPEMCAGSTLVAVTVDANFEGQVVLTAGCREGNRSIPPGDRETVVREEESESCSITLSLDGEIVYSDEIPGHQRTSLTVTETGEIEEEHVVY